MKKIDGIEVVHSSTPAIEDSGMVRMGFLSPSFPPVRSAPAKVVTNNGKVRTGFLSPAFPPARSR